MTSQAGARYLAQEARRTVQQNCTWTDCPRPASHTHKTPDGHILAVLCDSHQEEVEAAIASKETKRMLTAWARAQGSRVTPRVM